MSVLSVFNEGEIFFRERKINAKDLEWNSHASFTGVYLKHLVKGVSTDGKFSSHIVRVNAGFEIGDHMHEDKWEMHEVISGSGKCIIDGKEIDYRPGISTVVPEGITHRVMAGNEDLYILAKFVPSLL
jgi:mannose-6-phosphate isomerase-like protein (cupin superfamily)